MKKRVILFSLLIFFLLCTTSHANIKQGFFLTTMTEEEIEGFVEHFPDLGERVRDWLVIGIVGENIIVHIITQDMPKADRLLQRIEYLGKSYKEIAQQAKAGDIPCGKAAKRIIFTTWEVDNPTYPEEGPEMISYRGSLGEWLTAGRPERLSGWYPAHVWLGQDIEIPDDDDVE